MHANKDPGLSSLIPAILRSIDHTMATEVAAEVTSANGKVLIDMIRRLLRWSVADLEQHRSLYGARIQAEVDLLEASRQVVPAGGGQATLYPAPTDMELQYYEESGILAAELTAQMRRAAPRHGGSQLAKRLRKLIEAEVRFHAALDPESAADIASAYHGGKSGEGRAVAAAAPSVTGESLTAYLRRRFPQHPSIAASEVVALPGGMGKDTILFKLDGHPAFSGPAVMRKDLKVLSLDVSAVDEFPLLEAVYAAGVRVPQPLWAEHDPGQLGSRFIVVRRSPGAVAISQDISKEDTRRHFADKLAEGLAAIHNLPLPDNESSGQSSGKSIVQCLHHQIETWRGYWMKKRLEPSIKLELLFTWLEGNVPADPGFAPTLVHGDYGFHNLLMDEGEVSAILDWEFAHVGDPAEDVNYCRQFIERYVPFDYFLERYLARGGKPYDAARDRFFTVWRNVRNAVASVGALNAFYRETPGNIKMVTAGLAYNPRFELEALRLVLGYIEGDEL